MKTHIMMVVALSLLATGPVWAAEFFVSPEGMPSKDGSSSKPWDMATALARSEQVKPGDTVRLQAGTYRGGFVWNRVTSCRTELNPQG